MNSIRNLRPGTDPDPAEILLYGHDPDGQPWLWSGDECSLPSRALDEGETIAFEFGLRLPKADDFDPGWITDGEFSNELDSLCINEDGEVTDLRG
jgi:hypothetical protein